MKSGKITQKRYTLMVGLKDKDEREQRIQTEKIIDLIKVCCKGYGVAFSCYLQSGGYVFKAGEYILENSVCIVLIDPDEKLVDELGKDLCAFMNQESVLVTVDEVESYYISESL